MEKDDVLKFTTEVRQFLELASQNGKISTEKIENIRGMLQNAKQSALAQGKDVAPITDLIGDLESF